MSSLITTVATAREKVSDVSVGATQTTTTWHPTHGDKSAWDGADVDWWWNGRNPEIEAAKFSGKNGKSHRQNFSLGCEKGRYPHKQLRCVEFKFGQNSTAGHGLFLKRYGLIWHKYVPSLPGNTSMVFWSSGHMGRRGDYDWHTIRLPFKDLGFDNFITENHVFVGIALQVSSEGGSGSRTTELKIEDLNYEWRSVGGKHLIVPPSRPYAERFQLNRIA